MKVKGCDWFALTIGERMSALAYAVWISGKKWKACGFFAGFLSEENDTVSLRK